MRYPIWRHKQITYGQGNSSTNHSEKSTQILPKTREMNDGEPTSVPKQVFKLLDTRLRRQIRIIETNTGAYDEDGSVITNIEIQRTVLRAFEKTQELLDTWENELAKQSLYEAYRQIRNPEYADDLLARATQDFLAFSNRIGDSTVTLNRICQASVGHCHGGHAGHGGQVNMIEGVPHRRMRYRRAENGLPIMPDPKKNPLIFITIRGLSKRGNQMPTEVMGMPDSGTNRNLCSGKFAEENGLIVNPNETVKMYAANKMQLTCLGVTKIFVKYFQIE